MMFIKLSHSLECFRKWLGMQKNWMELNMSFLIKGDELLRKSNEIWHKFGNSIKTGFGYALLKTKTSCEGKINTNFHNRIPKQRTNWIYLSVTLFLKSVKTLIHICFASHCKIKKSRCNNDDFERKIWERSFWWIWSKKLLKDRLNLNMWEQFWGSHLVLLFR